MPRLPILIVVLDGAADRAGPGSAGVTPLQAARTPHLDRLAQRGQLGLLYPVAKGVAPESHAAAFALLGYNPLQTFLSRGVVEALGVGLPFEEGDLAVRCDFATTSDDMIIDRRAGRNLASEEAAALAKTLNEELELSGGVQVELRPTIAHRAVLVFRRDAHPFSHEISNVDPAYERVGQISIARAGLKLPVKSPACHPLSQSEAAVRTAQLVNEFTRKARHILDNHPINRARRECGHLPANFLLLRDAGTARPPVAPVTTKYGVRGIVLADMPVELGIAKIAALDVARFDPQPGAEAYRKRAEEARRMATRYDLTFVHLKGPDEPGHDGDFQRKTAVIEEIDAGFFSVLAESVSAGKVLLCVTSDHATPCSVRAHSDDPVPLLLAGRALKADRSNRFTETEAADGSLGIVEHGWTLMPMLIRAAEST